MSTENTASKFGADSHKNWRAESLPLLAEAVAALKGEDRPGQRDLATAVSEAIRYGHHLVSEAPTGSGKSLAYLVPAIASGLRVVVATSTIALQDQLIGKDLPQLASATNVRFTATALKGRANYVCLSKIRTADAPETLFDQRPGASFDDDLRTVRDFSEASPTGDRAELPGAIPDSSWAAFSCTGQECPGANECSDGVECFAEKVRTRASESEIVVVNHALACLDIGAEGNVLPDHDILIVDEAHALAEAATRSFGADLSPSAIGRLGTLLGKHGATQAMVKNLKTIENHLETLLNQHKGERLTGEAFKPVQGTLVSIGEHLSTARAGLSKSDNPESKRANRLAATRIETVRRMAGATATDVVWVDGDGPSIRLRLAPLEVGSPMAISLLSTRPCIFVSATLGGEAPYRDFAAALGLDPTADQGSWGDPPGTPLAEGEPPERSTGVGYASLAVDPSFNWREQGTLFVDPKLPDPARNRDEWLAAGGVHLLRLVEASDGRALVLCTSRANVDHFASLIRDSKLDVTVLAQGDAAPAELTRRFIEDERSILVGTRTFWAGIDAPGTACVLVVIDRIPFPVPSEPLHAARREFAESEGEDAFATVDIPAAALTLAQGAGRLLRRRSDRGVVAVLDPRLATRSYRRALLKAVPPFRRTTDIEDACVALKSAAEGEAK